MMLEWFSFLIIGVFTGLSAGLLGLGGGLIIVPSLLLVFSWRAGITEHVMHIAIATSLMTIVVTSLSSMYAHHRQANVNWPIVFSLSPGLLLGGAAGAYFATLFSSSLLQILFAIYLVVVAINMWLPSPPKLNLALLKSTVLFFTGNVIGIISAVVGIGGGSLTVPYLLMAEKSIHNAVGVAAACGFPIAVSAVLGYILFAPQDIVLQSDWLTGYIHWQAFLGIICSSIVFVPIGAKLATRLPVQQLRQLFSIVLSLVAVYLFWMS